MSNDAATTRYPGYDVLNKRDTPSWDPVTRQVMEDRLALPAKPRYFDDAKWAVLTALCNRIVAQPDDRPVVPVAAMVDTKLHQDQGDGWRDARMPPLRNAWCTGLAALEAESRAAYDTGYAQLTAAQQTALIERMQRGELRHAAWQGMLSDLFFSQRVLHDLYGAYYSHPAAWSEIGFGGPANPRGYVRLNKDRRDPWEAIEATPENAATVQQANSRVR